ncbi:MAG: dTMP kinase [Christensenellales bacterium]|jgi:dTMP kinase
MNFDWFVFDLDGTLTESGDGIIRCARHALETLGAKPLADHDFARFIGPPLYWSYRNIANLSDADAQRAIELHRERYAEIGWRENRVYPGIAPLLRAIRRRGGKIALASAKVEPYCYKILEHFGLLQYFDRVCGAPMDERAPEKREIIARALEGADDLSRCVMVGDRVFDIEGARALGIDAVAVAYGYGETSEFTHAKHVVSTVSQLHELLVGARDPGYFITFEGADGSGKSTQFRMAQTYLTERGWEVVASREPGGCPIAERIREMLLDIGSAGMTGECEALLFAAARAQHVREVIRPAIAVGKIVLCDRFLDSSIAFQAYGRELTEPVVRQMNTAAVNGQSPDLTLLYTTDLATARGRVSQVGAADRIEREGDEFMMRVYAGFEALAAREPGRIRTIDAERGIEEVFEETARVITRLTDSRS